jgi:hypothetical protein
LQLEAARIVTGLPMYSSAESLYFETGILPTMSQPMYLIYLYQNLIFFQFEVG